MQTETREVGGVTFARGYRAAAVNCGIRSRRNDLALLVSDGPASAAGLFTTNRVQAAPVKLCRERVARGVARAIVVNSGNANACTGSRGAADAERMAALAARAAGVAPEEVLVCSTGTIGIPLPIDRIEAGIAAAAAALRPDGGSMAAAAILTTDTAAKECAVEVDAGGVKARVGGMAKGAGMIDPCLATMLAFLTTDAKVRPAALQALLAEAADLSFNRITIDGDQSTNDTLLMLANGAAGGEALEPGGSGWEAFSGAVQSVCRSLALQIVRDGEGATKFVTVRVRGAVSRSDARRAAKAVANSLLCKTAWFGGDPNWGRILAAVGRSGAALDPDRVTIAFDGQAVVSGGCLADGASLAELARIYAQPEFVVEVGLGVGAAEDEAYTCDCSYDYVKINASYMT
jgi:glutamate N-acetyltransferase/amino-acid N-acetyltransferase